METVKFICEFFFTNFWHFLGLLFICCAIRGEGIFRISIKK